MVEEILLLLGIWCFQTHKDSMRDKNNVMRSFESSFLHGERQLHNARSLLPQNMNKYSKLAYLQAHIQNSASLLLVSWVFRCWSPSIGHDIAVLHHRSEGRVADHCPGLLKSGPFKHLREQCNTICDDIISLKNMSAVPYVVECSGGLITPRQRNQPKALESQRPRTFIFRTCFTQKQSFCRHARLVGVGFASIRGGTDARLYSLVLAP